MAPDEIIVGIDIGTTKIAAVVGRTDEYGKVSIIGLGTHPSKGLRRGVVINIQETVDSIRQAISEAEMMSGQKVTTVYTGIAGDHIRSMNSKGVIAVGSKDRIITQDDVDRVISAARAIALPMDREILHCLPQEYIVDDQDGIRYPVGMAGTRLEAEMHIVTAAIASAQNIINCIHQAGYEVADLVLEPYASSLSVLHPDELDMGISLIDIGGGTTDIAMFFDGSIRYTSVIGLGGQHVTSDLSHGLRTTMEQAEEIKKKHGIAMHKLLREDVLISVPGVGGRAAREIARSVVCGVIEPRMEEIFTLAMQSMEKSGVLDSMGAGVVLTGGASLLEGADILAEKILGLPVKIGKPKVSGGVSKAVESPIYATGVGLIYYALKHGATNLSQDTGNIQNWLDRVKNIFENLFR